MAMLLVLISLVLFIGIGIAVKMFDTEIRVSKYGKLVVDMIFFLAIALMLAGIIKCIGGF